MRTVAGLGAHRVICEGSGSATAQTPFTVKPGMLGSAQSASATSSNSSVGRGLSQPSPPSTPPWASSDFALRPQGAVEQHEHDSHGDRDEHDDHDLHAGGSSGVAGAGAATGRAERGRRRCRSGRVRVSESTERVSESTERARVSESTERALVPAARVPAAQVRALP